MIVIAVLDAAVGDGDAMGIAPEIGEELRHLPRHSPFRRISKIANPAVGRICENRDLVVLGGAA